MVRVNFVGQKKAKKVDQKIVLQKITQLISRHLVWKTGYEAGTGIPRLLGKGSNTGFSRHNKTGCNLPVCTTRFLRPKIERFFWRDFSGEIFLEKHYCPYNFVPIN